ncbi:unnamed protein product [Heligmosomoides polygyrus]|uniref:Deoxyribonuclease TATDN2 n=1 Tax=Heligmosomoides polygyrus TaxID=6339 RepID=A0A183FND6_HELPZ|nr:unnamed protein product [Heligmosomoides polygyrus]
MVESVCRVAKLFTKSEAEPEVQRKVFLTQLELAKEYDVPVVIHCRSGPNDDAEDDCLEVFKEAKISRFHNIHRHCFTGTWSVAEKWLDKFVNVYFGFTSLIAVWEKENKVELLEVLKQLPLTRILLETDAPFFRPRQKAVSTVKNLETNDDVDQPGSPKKRKAEDDLDVAVEIVTVKKAREGESDESQEAPTKAEEGNKPTEEAAATDAESAEKPEAVVEAAEKAGATDAETAVKPEAVVEAAEEAGSADGKSVSAAEAEEEPDTATGGVEAELTVICSMGKADDGLVRMFKGFSPTSPPHPEGRKRAKFLE